MQVLELASLGLVLVVSGLVLEPPVVGAKLVAVVAVKLLVVEARLAVVTGLREEGFVVVMVVESEEVELRELQLVRI